MSILVCTPMERPTRTIKATDGSSIYVSEADYDRLARHRWWICRRSSGLAYAHTRLSDGEHVYMHRLIAGPASGQVVDHINDETLDNRRENLRVCTQADNIRNRRGNAGASGYRGVQLVKHVKRKPWRVRIKVDGRFKYLGYYESIDGAIAAYNAAAIQFFGEYARPHV